MEKILGQFVSGGMCGLLCAVLSAIAGGIIGAAAYENLNASRARQGRLLPLVASVASAGVVGLLLGYALPLVAVQQQFLNYQDTVSVRALHLLAAVMFGGMSCLFALTAMFVPSSGKPGNLDTEVCGYLASLFSSRAVLEKHLCPGEQDLSQRLAASTEQLKEAIAILEGAKKAETEVAQHKVGLMRHNVPHEVAEGLDLKLVKYQQVVAQRKDEVKELLQQVVRSRNDLDLLIAQHNGRPILNPSEVIKRAEAAVQSGKTSCA
jgi:hypothetical protein